MKTAPTKQKGQVLFCVENLLGQGHGRRISAIAAACRDIGLETSLVSGTVEGDEDFPCLPLPSIRWDGPSFSRLVDGFGEPVSEEVWQQRRVQIGDALATTRPDIVVVEGFPFARRRFASEITAMAESARKAGATLFCSVRDIIQPLSSGKGASETKIEACLRYLNTGFNALLIHGDPDLVDFSRSFPPVAKIEIPIYYTGYVDHAGPKEAEHHSANQQDSGKAGAILVAAGSGTAGAALYQAALTAAQTNKGKAYSWHILTGANATETQHLPDHITVEANRSDYRQLLMQASCSVSQCGYNTAMDLAQCTTPALVIPFEGQGEQEQVLRGTRFEAAGWWQMLQEKDLSPETLLQGIENALKAGPQDRRHLALDGAQRSAQIILEARAKHVTGNLT